MIGLGLRTNRRKPRHLEQGARYVAEERDDHADNPKNNAARSVLGERVHRHGESEDMASHDENEEKNLGGAEHLAADASHENFSRIGHVVDVGISEFELAQHKAGVRGERTQADNEDDRSTRQAGRLLELASFVLVVISDSSTHSPYQTQLGNNGRQRQNTKRYSFSDHDWGKAFTSVFVLLSFVTLSLCCSPIPQCLQQT